MKWISKEDIQRWAETYESKGYLPTLINKLVLETTLKGTRVNFPSGSGVYIGGWDGQVICYSKTTFVPMGTSLYEIGTEKSSRRKANEDATKRSLNALGFESKECTLIIITGRYWKNKNKTKEELETNEKWLEVLIYDSERLEQWLDLAPVTSRWFSIIIGKYPNDGIQSTEDFWKEWSSGPRLKLQPNSVTTGRENQSRQLFDFLNGQPAIKAVSATSKEEAIAFIVGTAMLFKKEFNEIFFSKSLIIDSTANFRSISNNQNNLFLISRIEETGILYRGVSDGHHVLVPLGADDKFNQDTILLPSLDRDGLINSLIESGLSNEQATNYSKESARNIIILKRLLDFPYEKIEWAKAEHCREIIPALLLGRWDENKSGDKQLIELFSGEPYDDYINRLVKWRDFEVPALLQIGETWRLASPMDAWASLASLLTKTDLENLKKGFLDAFQNGNPVIEKDNDFKFSSPFLQQETLYSNWSREGLVQSLILVGFYGERFKIPSLNIPQLWVDKLISELLINANNELWISLKRELPLIAEASPDSFLKAVENSLELDSKPIMKMFEESEGFIMPISYQSNLLWALEAVAWLPEYLLKASSLLCKLAALDPGGQLNNRPINSLSEIFKPWHYQTFATFEDRMRVLKQLTKANVETTWDLLITMLPDPLGGIAMPTNKMRWRLFDYSKETQYTNNEFWDTHTAVIDLLLSIFDFTEDKLSTLIKESGNKQLGIENQNKILSFIEKVAVTVPQIDYSAWHSIRHLLSRHRSHPDTDWALSQIELMRYEKIYFQIQPLDEIEQELWLFNEHWPDFSEGFNHINDIGEKRQVVLTEKRILFFKKIYEKYGIQKIKELVYKVTQLRIFGEIAGDVIENENDILCLCELLNEIPPILDFIFGFLQRKSYLKTIDWAIDLFKKMESKSMSNTALANILLPLESSKKLWEFINTINNEIKKIYWKNVSPYFYRLNEDELIIGFNSLIIYKRYLVALNECSRFIEKNLPTSLIIEILYKAATEKTDELLRIRDYEVERIFKELDKRTDIEESVFINLEMLYLNYLASYGSNRLPQKLHNAITNSPAFFVELLTYQYKPDNDDIDEKDELTSEQKSRRAHKVYELLNSWEQIPGVSENGSIDKNILDTWINDVLTLAKESNRSKAAEIEIGKILAQYPEKIAENWPPTEICKTIESINTETVKNNFRSAVFNKRGTYSKGAFEGGQQEWALSAKFHQYSLSIINEFPNVAAVLESLAKGYEYDAKEEDKSAQREALEH